MIKQQKGCGKLISKREKMYPDRDDMNQWGISTGYICGGSTERLCPSCLNQSKEIMSNCCGARILEDSDVCSSCAEHCDEVKEDE